MSNDSKHACASEDAYSSIGSILETIKLEFTLAAKGGPTDGTALSAAIRELPRKSVSFNDCVQVKWFRFSGNETAWRKVKPGSTARMWEDARRKTAERRAAQGNAVPASPRVPDRLRMIPDKILVDTGASWHMASRKTLPPEVVRTARRLKIPIKLSTANGDITVSAVVDIKPPGFDHTVEALLLDDTPTVVSVGKFCMDYGFGFYWPPNTAPFLIAPTGEKIDFVVDNNVPYWPAPGGREVTCLPAMAGTK